MQPNFLVGIGGSAGAFNAYTEFLDALPAKTGMAFVIISHMNPTANTQLAQLLARHTKMPVELASTATPIRANCLYIIPPNSDLQVEGGAFKITTPRASRAAQVNVFLTSIAEAVGERAIGIIFSGYLDDGAEGCKRIKAKGGITFAQDASAEVPDMPLMAQAAGGVDFVMPPKKIAAELQRLAVQMAGKGPARGGNAT